MQDEFELIGPLSTEKPSYAQQGRLPGVLRSMLDQSNGAYAYDGAFVILPSAKQGRIATMEQVNGGAWKEQYSQEVQDTWFFAVDVRGWPFGIRNDEIVHLNPETGVLTTVTDEFGDLFDAINTDPDGMVGLDCLHGWTEIGLKLEIGERLVAKEPIMMGGGNQASAYGAGDLMDVLDYHADLYRQVKDIPDGKKVLFVVKK